MPIADTIKFMNAATNACRPLQRAGQTSKTIVQ